MKLISNIIYNICDLICASLLVFTIGVIVFIVCTLIAILLPIVKLINTILNPNKINNITIMLFRGAKEYAKDCFNHQ